MYSGVFMIFLPLVLGYFITLKNEDWHQKINKAVSYLIYVILFFMGLSLSSLDNLGSNLQTIALFTFTFFICIGTCNVAALPLVDKWLPIEAHSKAASLPIYAMALESAKLIVVVGAGLVIGLLVPFHIPFIAQISESILLLLLFFIGIQLRNSGLTLRQIILNKRGMIIATIIVVTSWVGGIIASYILNIPMTNALAMSSGFGWYSLAGILMGDAYGPVYGGASFMLELLRELVALITIPMLIRRYPCTSIGYAGATAMDFTLPVIQNTGGVKCVPIAIVSGFILSLLVPILMLFFVSLGA
ncbi:lysine exporter LysO family protein [Vibrio gangliei]|uniref:lysine exporter LysO family protein n=1 Tax=Vibrio gangliei TaxID=2077090 RepID=UPI000D01FD95|nr:lysine exporter LysO family protein [Vibrio gangliei]